MSGSREYFDLIASLPRLPYFEEADRNPINRARLEDRLSFLEPEDQATVRDAADFLGWSRQPAGRTDSEVVWMASQFLESTESPALRQLVEYRMNQRTVMAALRRKNRRMDAPLIGERWGVGEWTAMIRRNWDDPNLKLGSVFTWIPQARSLMESGDALGLDRLLFREEWRWVDSLGYGSSFRFEAVIAYLFQWDILDHWLSYDAQAAAKRFEELVLEVTGEHYKLFD